MGTFESYWNKFLKNDQKTYDGHIFEDLVEELLALMYGNKWNSTPATHDGNKDFFLRINDETFWAECKNYKEVLSLKILAPTLVMAQVCDANTILFFSRSAINRFAKEKITVYGQKTSKEVMFYDDELLERLILKYNGLLSSKFQIPLKLLQDNENLNSPLNVSEFFFPSILSKMITTEDDYINYKNARLLHYNEPFSLLINIYNNSIENCTIEVSFDEDCADRNNYEYLNNGISYETNFIKTFNLKPGQSKCLSLSLRVTTFKRNLFLPNFHVKYLGTNNFMTEWKSRPVNVECKWVGLTKLLGSHYNNIIQKVEENLTNNIEFSGMLLTGNSGTGKSRILNECCCPLIKNGYRILELNVTKEHSTCNLLKEIIYFIYEVPPELIIQVITDRIEGKTFDNLDKNMHLAVRIAKMIESLDDDFDIFMDKYKDLLFEKMAQMKIAIIVDNMQFASIHFHVFWRCYVAFSVNQCRINTSLFITSINLDYLTEESAKTIYVLQNSNIKHFVNEYIDGFKDKNQGILFLRELIRINDERFDSLFEEIIESLSLNPFNLYQMVKLLEEDEVIKSLPDKQGYLLPPEAVWKTTWKIPKTIDNVLLRRFSFVLDNISKSSFYKILSACYLFETIDVTIRKLLKIECNDLKYLVEHQILIQTEQGFSFVHDIIRRYYEQNWANERLYCLHDVENLKCLRSYESIYKLYRISILKDESYIIKLCQNRNLSIIPVRLQGIFLEEMFEHCIESTSLMNEAQSWFGALNWLCNSSRSVMGSRKALDYYNRVWGCIENTFDNLSLICCIELRHLLHSLCDIHIQMHNRDAAVDFANRIIECLSIEPTAKHCIVKCPYQEVLDEYYVLKAIMFNRIFCAYNNAFPTDEIVLKRENALNSSRALIPFIKNAYKRNLISYLNDSDDGYRYYGFQCDYGKLESIWKKCLIDIPSVAPEKTMNYYRKQVQCHLIKQDEISVKKYISEGRYYLANGEYSHEPLIFNTFFTMAEAINNLQHRPIEMYLYTESLIDKLTQIQLLLKSNKMGDIFLLKGINAFYANDSQTVYHALKKAYQAYNEKETSYYWIKRELIKETIIMAYTMLGINKSHYDISFLPKECREQLHNFSQEDFQAKGIIRTKDGLFNLPLVV